MVLIVLGVTQPSWVEVVNADGEGWYSSWPLRKAITIDATKVSSGPHTNFPVLINLSSDASLASRAQSDGDDILFTSSNGTTKLSHEIEKYTSSTGALVAWVKVPSLSSASNTVLYMYYGDASVASQQDSTNVWDSNYKAVWHLKETSGSSYSDSSANANNSTSAPTPPTPTAGQIGGGQLFVDDSADDDRIQFPSGSLDIVARFTGSGWFRVDVIGWWHAVDKYSCNYLDFGPTSGIWSWFTSAGSVVDTATVAAGEWHYVSWVKDATNLRLYRDGVLKASTATTADLCSNSNGVLLGQFSGGAVTYAFKGVMDEVRISNIDRSAGWITTEYNNQGTPTTFYSVGSATSPTANFFQLFE